MHALNADAHVTVVCPRDQLNPEVSFRVAQTQVRLLDRLYDPTVLPLPPFTADDANYSGTKGGNDVSNATNDWGEVSMVFVAIDDPIVSSEICTQCRALRIPVNVSDVPPECDFYFGSTYRNGPLQIMVSSNGKGPKLVNIVRRRITEGLPENIGESFERIGVLRAKLREQAPGTSQKLIAKRMTW